MYGVHRTAPLARLPDLNCIYKVLDENPNVTKVTYERGKTGRRLSWRGLGPPGTVHTFAYEGRDGFGGKGVWGFIQMVVRIEDPLEFSHYMITMGEPPRQESVDSTRPVMSAIEADMEEKCGVAGLKGSIKEKCDGVKCPPL